MLIQYGWYLIRFDYKYLAPYHDYQVSCRQSMLCPAKAFTEQPLQLVSLYRCRYLFSRYRKSQARAVTRFSSDKDRDTGVSTSKIVLKYLLKLESTR